MFFDSVQTGALNGRRTACLRSAYKPSVSPFAGRLTFLVSTRKVSKRNDPGGAGWRCAPTTLLCSGFAGALELARYAGSNRQGPFFRKTFRASAAPTGNCGSAASDWLGSRVAGRASQDLLDQAGVAGRGMDAEASIVRPWMACRWTPDKSEKRRAPATRAGRPGALSLGYFSLCKQREVTRPSMGRNPRFRSTVLPSSAHTHQHPTVVPAKAGTHLSEGHPTWIPAFAGMTTT